MRGQVLDPRRHRQSQRQRKSRRVGGLREEQMCLLRYPEAFYSPVEGDQIRQHAWAPHTHIHTQMCILGEDIQLKFILL